MANTTTVKNFRPLHDRVLVRRVDEDEKSAGGIIIPDTAKEKPSQGEILAAGPGARDDSGKIVKLDVKVGDRILFGKWSGTEGHPRRRGADHHEGIRRDGRAQGRVRQRLSAGRGDETWLPRT